jgi:hypothetical protein
MNRGVAAGVVVALGAFSPAALAVEREHHLGVDAGASLLVVGGQSSPEVGAGIGAHWTYGLSDALNLMVEAAGSRLAVNEAQGASQPHVQPAWMANADVGIGYVFDVMQWVPYAGLLVGGYALSGGTIQGAKVLPGAAFALGLDYRFGRSLAAGISIRQHMLTEVSTYPSFTLAFARLEYTWGW